MSFLLPQTRTGVVQSLRPVDLHGDRYLDLTVAFAEPDAAPATGRVSALECPQGLAVGERVSIRFTLGVMTRVERADATERRDA